MKPGSVVVIDTMLAAVLALGCGADDGASNSSDTSGPGDNTTGPNDTTTGPNDTSAGPGGTTSDGPGATTGSDSGGANTSDTAGDSGDTGTFWEDDYDPNALPTPADGEHHDGDNCMQCHGDGNDVWLFGGTVYRSDGTTGAASVQIGILMGGSLRTAYSATNGNFWFADDGGSIDWANAEARMRNSNGEAIMPSPPASGCALCHSGSNLLIEP
jgi:hypothetical protein